MTNTIVPELEDMRLMSDVELLKLRTNISYEASDIEAQLRRDDDPDPEWTRKAKGAQLARSRGINAIKNILAERHAERKSNQDSEIRLWLLIEKLMNVHHTAAVLLEEDDSDAAWQHLEMAVGTFQSFCVEHSIIEMALRQSDQP